MSGRGFLKDTTMRKFQLLFSFLQLLLLPELQAQKIQEKSVIGIYMLEGVMETAAGLELKPDHTFEYWFTYGAADKWGKGTWKLTGQKLQLTSHHTQPEQDFVLKQSDNNYKQGIRIIIIYEPGKPLQYVKCRLGNETAESDASGEVDFKNIADGQLEMYHPIYGTRLTRISLDKNKTNFVIATAADPSEVYFRNFELEAKPDELVAGQLPGMPPEDTAGKLKRYVFHRKN